MNETDRGRKEEWSNAARRREGKDPQGFGSLIRKHVTVPAYETFFATLFLIHDHPLITMEELAEKYSEEESWWSDVTDEQWVTKFSMKVSGELPLALSLSEEAEERRRAERRQRGELGEIDWPPGVSEPPPRSRSSSSSEEAEESPRRSSEDGTAPAAAQQAPPVRRSSPSRDLDLEVERKHFEHSRRSSPISEQAMEQEGPQGGDRTGGQSGGQQNPFAEDSPVEQNPFAEDSPEEVIRKTEDIHLYANGFSAICTVWE